MSRYSLKSVGIERQAYKDLLDRFGLSTDIVQGYLTQRGMSREKILELLRAYNYDVDVVVHIVAGQTDLPIVAKGAAAGGGAADFPKALDTESDELIARALEEKYRREAADEELAYRLQAENEVDENADEAYARRLQEELNGELPEPPFRENRPEVMPGAGDGWRIGRWGRSYVLFDEFPTLPYDVVNDVITRQEGGIRISTDRARQILEDLAPRRGGKKRRSSKKRKLNKKSKKRKTNRKK